MQRATIHFGCDLGERADAAGAALDARLLECINMANIACGGHAGDDNSMRRVMSEAQRRGVLIGAHPSYEDRARFGRVSTPLTPAAISELVQRQVATLAKIAESLGAKVTHVKPHGALYHDAMHREDVAAAIADGVTAVNRSLGLVGLAGGAGLEVWRARGFRVLREAFADRRYEPNGTLRAREFDDALIGDPAECAEQARRLATGEGVIAVGGERISVACDIICIHSDIAGAAARALAVRQTLNEL